MPSKTMTGTFADFDGERWYRIDDYDNALPFFVALVSDSDVWAFVSSAGSLAAGRVDQQNSFFPYETVDKIHGRFENAGPRTWIRIKTGETWQLWMPFAPQPGQLTGKRSLWKNRLGNRLMFREAHPTIDLWFSYEWSAAQDLGLVRTARIGGQLGLELQILDGMLGLLPCGVNNTNWNEYSNLSAAYAWNEAHEDKLGLYTIYAQIWDRAEPKESFDALAAWHTAPDGARVLLSSRQLDAFIETGTVEAETLTRGMRGAFLQNFDLCLETKETVWHQVLDGRLSQVRVADLLDELRAGKFDSTEIKRRLDRCADSLAALLACSDAFQESGDEMAAAHHLANVIFNTMRGGTIPSGTQLEIADLIEFARKRNPKSAIILGSALASLGSEASRELALNAAQKAKDPQALRLVNEYLPLTFSRRHGDPSRPWNKFSIRVHTPEGKRIRDWQGNWRDIFQNWEALGSSYPDFIPAMIATFLSAMTPDGHNPYRVTRNGIDWEVVEPDNNWSFIGYWGDHQVVYLLKFLEQAEAMQPGLLASMWAQPLFTYAAVPYRIRGHAAMVANPKITIDFDEQAHAAFEDRCKNLGADGRLVLDAEDQPVLANLGEKLLTILLAKTGILVPGGGMWLNTQRPEWNDANNALVGFGLSMVSLAALRRFLGFLNAASWVDAPFIASSDCVKALSDLTSLAKDTPLSACTDPQDRRKWFDEAGTIMETWRRSIYGDVMYEPWRTRSTSEVPSGSIKALIKVLLPLVDATLASGRRADGLFQSYNLLRLEDRKAEVTHLYPMLEGQVAILGSGFLDATKAAKLVETLYASAMYRPDQNSFLLYPDRKLPGFLERNILDPEAMAQPEIRELLADGRSDILETQTDGTVRFHHRFANRYDVEEALKEALKDCGDRAHAIGETYERLLNHREFTGRSGTMFAFEGLGCIYWHMVAKLLLAVQENVFQAADSRSSELPRLISLYRKVRAGLGYKRSVAEYGAFPFDPYSHTPSQAGAQQPGMTGQVKEEILTRWGELGLRWKGGMLSIDPVLFESAEFDVSGTFKFSYQRVPFVYRRALTTKLSVMREGCWEVADCAGFDLRGVSAVELYLAGS